MGSHANLNAICERFSSVKTADGGRQWQLNYCGVEPRTWAMSLFSMLLTCFTMEQTFYMDYADRLKLDHVLVHMRREFETHKEHVRKYLKVKYEVPPPQPKSILVLP